MQITSLLAHAHKGPGKADAAANAAKPKAKAGPKAKDPAPQVQDVVVPAGKAPKEPAHAAPAPKAAGPKAHGPKAHGPDKTPGGNTTVAKILDALVQKAAKAGVEVVIADDGAQPLSNAFIQKVAKWGAKIVTEDNAAAPPLQPLSNALGQAAASGAAAVGTNASAQTAIAQSASAPVATGLARAAATSGNPAVAAKAGAQTPVATGLTRAAAASGNPVVAAKAASTSPASVPASTGATNGSATAKGPANNKILVINLAQLRSATYVRQLMSQINQMKDVTSAGGATAASVAAPATPNQAIAQTFLHDMGMSVADTSHQVRAMKTYQEVVSLITRQLGTGQGTVA